MHLAWVRLVVEDFAGAFDFYRQAMSLAGVAEDRLWIEHGYGHFWNCSSQSRLELEIVERARFVDVFGAVRHAETPTLVFLVHDVEAAVAEAVARGAVVVVEPRYDKSGDARVRVAQVRDPIGTLLELVWHEPTPFGEPIPLDHVEAER